MNGFIYTRVNLPRSLVPQCLKAFLNDSAMMVRTLSVLATRFSILLFFSFPQSLDVFDVLVPVKMFF